MRRWLWLVMSVGLMTIIACASASSNAPAGPPRPTSTIAPTITPSPFTYLDIERNWGRMTTIQWEEYSQGLPGTRVRWTGTVNQVERDGKVSLDVGQSPVNYCGLYGLPREEVVNWNKGTAIEFEARIKEISVFLILIVRLDSVDLLSVR